MTPTTLTHEDLEDILNGAVIYGSGGGGPITSGQSLLKRLLKAKTPILLADPHADVADDATMAIPFFHSPVNQAPDVSVDVNEAVGAFKALSKQQRARSGRDFSFVLPVETGAESMVTLAIAAQTGLPIIDGDGCGRGVIALTMTTYAARGLPIAPIMMANGKMTLTLNIDSPANAGPLWATIDGAPFNGDAGLAFWAMDGKAMKSALIPGTLTRARNLGAVLRKAKAAGQNPVQAVVKHLGATILGVGPIVGSSTPQSDMQVGFVSIRSSTGEQITVYNLRENLMAWDATKSAPLAMGPDLICYLTTDGQPFTNEDLELATGKEVAIFALPCDPALRAPSIIEAFMGVYRAMLYYGGPYVPVEHLI